VIGVITDHGHRAGQEHFVIVIIWSGYDKEGGETYKYFCPSIDSAGHTAEKASEALKNVLECTLGSDVEVLEATKAEIKQPMTEKAIESKSGYDLTATMGGKLKFSTITKKDGFEPGVNEEIKVCKIPNILQEWIEAIGEV
jgi:hypothetical protein